MALPMMCSPSSDAVHGDSGGAVAVEYRVDLCGGREFVAAGVEFEDRRLRCALAEAIDLESPDGPRVIERIGDRGVVGKLGERVFQQQIREAVACRVCDRRSAAVIENVGETEFVLAPIPNSPGLAVTTIGIERLFAALPATHRLADADSVTLADLRDDNFVLPTEHVHELGQHIQSACHQAGFAPRDYARADNAIGLLSYVAAGLCVSLVLPCPTPV